jgi:hypothetical protein
MMERSTTTYPKEYRMPASTRTVVLGTSSYEADGHQVTERTRLVIDPRGVNTRITFDYRRTDGEQMRDVILLTPAMLAKLVAEVTTG